MRISLVPGRLSALLLTIAVAGCATRSETTDLRLVGASPAPWAGSLTAQRLYLRDSHGTTLQFRNSGFPCAPGAPACFFGTRDQDRYVNAVMPDGEKLSLTVDPQPCQFAGSNRRYPFRVSVAFHRGRDGQRSRWSGCGEPARSVRGARPSQPIRQ